MANKTKRNKGKKTTPLRLENMQLKNYVEYDLETYETGSDYDCYTHIERVILTEADLESIARDITTNDFDAYCAERIMTHFSWYDDDMWDFDWRTYYYGDEVFGAKPENLTEVSDTIDRCLALPEDERIPFLLELEYGYLLDVVKNRTWVIETIDKEDIIFGSQYHKTEVIERYKNYTLPVCIVLETPEGLTLIDGYHRFVVNEDKKILVIVGEK